MGLRETSNEYFRERIRESVESGSMRRLRPMRPFRDAADNDEALRIARSVLAMSDEDFTLLRERHGIAYQGE
jgi:hypothetical protein